MDTGHNSSDSGISSITVSALRALHGSAFAPIVLDVRKTPAWQADTHTLAGALRCAPDDLAKFAASLPRDRTIVAMCVHGHEVSQNATKALTGASLQASFLEGGITAWLAEGPPYSGKDSVCRTTKYSFQKHGMQPRTYGCPFPFDKATSFL